MFWQRRDRRPAPRLADVGDLTLAILDRPPGWLPRVRLLSYRAQLLYDDGGYREHGGDLAHLLDGEQLARLHALLDDIRRTARDKMIPGPRPGRG